MKKIISLLAVIILIVACKKSSTSAPGPDLTDIDGNSYNTIKIGTQSWMKQNLKTSHYRNGDLIPEGSSLTTGAWRWYNDDSATYAATYGKLYNWYAVHDARGLAPTGYHIPSDAEWIGLSTFLGGDAVAGGKMKETGTTHWVSPNVDATNSSGFSGLPGGSFDGLFTEVGDDCYLWSSTEYDTSNAWYCALSFVDGGVYRHYDIKQVGFSVRCLRD